MNLTNHSIGVLNKVFSIHHFSKLLLSISFLFFLFINPINLSAKKVICVDGCGTPFVNMHEAYERDNMAPGDKIQVGGSLTDCMAMLADGDQLIIIAHGDSTGGPGTGFTWGGSVYTGFGAGAGKIPIPPNFAGLDNCTVSFCTCWSGRDPDGTGAGNTNTSLTDKIIAAMGGTGNTASGYNDYATINGGPCYTYTNPADTTAIKNALANSTWPDHPPAGRPNIPAGTKNQVQQAQCDVDAIPGLQGTVTITKIKIDPPTNSVTPPPVGGCQGCTEGTCGFATTFADGQLLDPPTTTDYNPFDFEFTDLGGGFFDISPLVNVIDDDSNPKPFHSRLYINDVLIAQDNQMGIASTLNCPNTGPCTGPCSWIYTNWGINQTINGDCLGPQTNCDCHGVIPACTFPAIQLNFGDVITVIMDYDGLVIESNESNNEFTATFPIPTEYNNRGISNLILSPGSGPGLSNLTIDWFAETISDVGPLDFGTEIEVSVNGAVVHTEIVEFSYSGSGLPCLVLPPCIGTCPNWEVLGVPLPIPGICSVTFVPSGPFSGYQFCSCKSPFTTTANDIPYGGGPADYIIVTMESSVGAVSDDNDTDDIMTIGSVPLVPTLGEWGLILLSLILFVMAAVAIVQRSKGLSLARQNSKMRYSTRKFDAQLYKKIFVKALLFAPIVLGALYIAFGEILVADLFGTICSIAIVAYLIHFFKLNQEGRK